MRIIDLFRGDNYFLSNFYPCEVEYDGIKYLSSEAAYQAQKTLDVSVRQGFSQMDAKTSKIVGEELELRGDWEDVRLDVMYRVVTAKFMQNPRLKAMLLSTEDALLVEGNDWDDVFWGVCSGVGENNLGKILMRVRSELAP